VERAALGPDRRAGGAGGEEVGLRFERGGPLAGLQVHARAHGPECVGEGHDRAAVHDAGHRAEVIADGDLGDYEVGGDRDEPEPDEVGEESFEPRLQLETSMGYLRCALMVADRQRGSKGHFRESTPRECTAAG
jgi:hypothetical protein